MNLQMIDSNYHTSSSKRRVNFDIKVQRQLKFPNKDSNKFFKKKSEKQLSIRTLSSKKLIPTNNQSLKIPLITKKQKLVLTNKKEKLLQINKKTEVFNQNHQINPTPRRTTRKRTFTQLKTRKQQFQSLIKTKISKYSQIGQDENNQFQTFCKIDTLMIKNNQKNQRLQKISKQHYSQTFHQIQNIIQQNSQIKNQTQNLNSNQILQNSYLKHIEKKKKFKFKIIREFSINLLLLKQMNYDQLIQPKQKKEKYIKIQRVDSYSQTNRIDEDQLKKRYIQKQKLSYLNFFNNYQTKFQRFQQLRFQTEIFHQRHQQLIDYKQDMKQLPQEINKYNLPQEFQKLENKFIKQLNHLNRILNQKAINHNDLKIKMNEKINKLEEDILQMVHSNSITLRIKKKIKKFFEQFNLESLLLKNELSYINPILQSTQQCFVKWINVFKDNKQFMLHCVRQMFKLAEVSIQLFGCQQSNLTLQINKKQSQNISIDDKIKKIVEIKCQKCFDMQKKVNFICYWNNKSKPILRLADILFKTTFNQMGYDCNQKDERIQNHRNSLMNKFYIKNNQNL